MAIKYTQLINSFVSTEGSGGFMTNYGYYTFLVFHTDGSVRIAEGKYSDIAHLLPYIRTPMDDIAELKETIKKGLSDKLEAGIRHSLYTTSKTAPTEEEREKARQEYLDRIGIPNSFRW